jgi:hypothetical protein
VVITQDSVSGIPYETSLRCEREIRRTAGAANCRRFILRTEVDSMKLGYTTLAENVTDVVGPTALIILAELAAGLVANAFR